MIHTLLCVVLSGGQNISFIIITRMNRERGGDGTKWKQFIPMIKESWFSDLHLVSHEIPGLVIPHPIPACSLVWFSHQIIYPKLHVDSVLNSALWLSFHQPKTWLLILFIRRFRFSLNWLGFWEFLLLFRWHFQFARLQALGLNTCRVQSVWFQLITFLSRHFCLSLTLPLFRISTKTCRRGPKRFIRALGTFISSSEAKLVAKPTPHKWENHSLLF